MSPGAFNLYPLGLFRNGGIKPFCEGVDTNGFEKYPLFVVKFEAAVGFWILSGYKSHTHKYFSARTRVYARAQVKAAISFFDLYPLEGCFEAGVGLRAPDSGYFWFHTFFTIAENRSPDWD